MSKVGIVAIAGPSNGGTFQYTLSMIDSLRRVTAHDFTIYTPRGNDSYDGLGLPIIRLPSARSSLWSWLRGSRFLEADVLIAPIYTTRLLASKRPFIFTIHDLQERYYPENFSLAQRCWRAVTNKLLAERSRHIICESNFVRQDIAKFIGIETSKISVIAAPPISIFFGNSEDNAPSAELINRLNLPEQFAFYPAQFFPHKNHLRLIEAFAVVQRKFPNFQLMLTGEKKYTYQEVMARAAELSIAGHVRHLGYIDTATLAAVYSRATFVVVPTLFESISIPIYEAFLLGVPVTCSNVVALPEQVGNAALLFDPLSVEDIAAKMSNMLADADLRRNLAGAGRRRVGELTPQRYAEELAAVIDQVLAAR